MAVKDSDERLEEWGRIVHGSGAEVDANRFHDGGGRRRVWGRTNALGALVADPFEIFRKGNLK